MSNNRFFFFLSDMTNRMLSRSDDLPDQDSDANRYVEAELARHKREGVEMAVRARWVALAVIAVMLPFLNPRIEMLYYEFLLLCLAGVGWLQRRVARVGQSRAELAVIALDLTLMTFALVYPNPFASQDYPDALTYRFGGFIYFFVILAAGTLAYSWRTIFAIGNWTMMLWLFGAWLIWYFGATDPALTEATRNAFGEDSDLSYLLDPNIVFADRRMQEVVVFMLVAAILAISIRRFNKLLLNNAELLRERENLSRYFSPNVVEELSQNDEPLKQIRTHDVAVLFVDIVGFTAMAADTPPERIIRMLRGFHSRMEKEVFRYGGTLDKYLGDGLMATFGTPVATDADAANALRCAKAMLQTLDQWNTERKAAGETPIEASFGLHFGPVVLGDIGANRLEFAVIGNTVNVSSRLEKLTRDLRVHLALSEQLRAQVVAEAGEADPVLAGLVAQPPQEIRGLDKPLAVWTLA